MMIKIRTRIRTNTRQKTRTNTSQKIKAKRIKRKRRRRRRKRMEISPAAIPAQTAILMEEKRKRINTDVSNTDPVGRKRRYFMTPLLRFDACMYLYHIMLC